MLTRKYQVDPSALLAARPSRDLQTRMVDIIKQEVEEQERGVKQEVEEEGLDLSRFLKVEYLTEDEEQEQQKRRLVQQQQEAARLAKTVCEYHRRGYCRYGGWWIEFLS